VNEPPNAFRATGGAADDVSRVVVRGLNRGHERREYRRRDPDQHRGARDRPGEVRRVDFGVEEHRLQFAPELAQGDFGQKYAERNAENRADQSEERGGDREQCDDLHACGAERTQDPDVRAALGHGHGHCVVDEK